MALSVSSFGLDFICLMLTLNHFGVKGEEDSEMILVILNLVFLLLNVYWIQWVLSLRDHLPQYMSNYLANGALGLGIEMTEKTKKIGGIAASGFK